MKKLFFILTLALTVSLVACKEDEEPKNCADCVFTFCEGEVKDEDSGATWTAAEIEAIKENCTTDGIDISFN